MHTKAGGVRVRVLCFGAVTTNNGFQSSGRLDQQWGCSPGAKSPPEKVSTDQSGPTEHV